MKHCLWGIEMMSKKIEVKSGHNSHMRSLHIFMDKAPHNIAVRLWNAPFSIDEVTTPKDKIFRLFNIPYYYAGQIDSILRKYGE